MKRWMLDDLKRELQSRPEIKGWIISQDTIRRRERYFMRDPREGAGFVVDQDRDAHGQIINVRLMIRLEEADRQGEAERRFYPGVALDEQVSQAVASAKHGKVQAWALPDRVQGEVPVVRTFDPEIREDMNRVMEELTLRFREEALKERGATFNSAELFVASIDSELHFKGGLVHRLTRTKLYGEAAFSGKKDEYVSRVWSVDRGGLDIARLFDETARRALSADHVEMPKSGRYAVILDADVLGVLMNDCVSRVSARSAYHDLPHRGVGDEFIEGAEGDLLTLKLDPLLEMGADSMGISEEGVPLSEVVLIRENRVQNWSTPKQYADYLGMPVTASRGDVVLESGSKSYEEMTRFAPQVLEILQFSGLFTDPGSGTFSSEIRLARLYDHERGEVRYLKGGSLSGSVYENFRKAWFSKNRVKWADFTEGGRGYFGPEHALLSDVSIVG